MGLVKSLLLAVFLVVMSMPVLGAGFTYEVKAINNSIFSYEIATYEISITNLRPTVDNYQFSSSSVQYVLVDRPAFETMPAGPQETVTTTITVDPKQGIGVGPHAVPVKIRSLQNGDFEEFNIPINIKETDYATYVPSVALTVDIDKALDPRETASVFIRIRNRNALDIPTLDVKVESSLPQISKEYTTSLDPLEEKSNEFLFELDPMQPPGDHNLNVKLYYLDKKISESTLNFKIGEYNKFEVEEVVDKGFFKKTRAVTVTNVGNAEKTYVHKLAYNWFQRIFTSENPKAELMEDNGKSVLVWTLSLGANATASVSATTNYIPLVTAIIIILLIILGYFIFRSPIVAFKDAIIYDVGGKEDTSELKVRLFIKNRTRSPLHNVKVIDKVPSIAEIKEDKTVGSLSPSKVIRSAKKGTLVKWNLEMIEPWEERIITYTIRSKLQIVGGVTLPPVKVRFDSKPGLERTTNSNEVGVSVRDKRK
ncbi:hypothetical protein JW868_01810 [Candidatus Woesearchaeota archaeon]|nr:hypothetical protein [Candidatus Woesearchaeota archaeon]